MFRLFLWCIKAAIIVGLALLIYRNPGTIDFQWLGYQGSLPIGLAILGVIFIILVVVIVYTLYRKVRNAPKNIKKWKTQRKMTKGMDSISDGLIAVATGDKKQAHQYAKKAEKFIDGKPVTLLLSAQAATMNDNEVQANHYYKEMLRDPKTEFLGLRGLINQALKKNDTPTALTLIRRANSKNRDLPWVLDTAQNLEIQEGNFPNALSVIEKAHKKKLKPVDVYKRESAALLTQCGYDALYNGDINNAQDYCRKSRKISDTFLSTQLLWIDILTAQNKSSVVGKYIKKIWQKNPNKLLFEKLMAIHEGKTIAQRVKIVEKLTAKTRLHFDSIFALATIYTQAENWKEAHKYATEAHAIDPHVGVESLLASIIQNMDDENKGDYEQHLKLAVSAPTEPHWQCTHCGQQPTHWQVVCGQCHSFNRIEWRHNTIPTPKAESITADKIEE